MEMDLNIWKNLTVYMYIIFISRFWFHKTSKWDRLEDIMDGIHALTSMNLLMALLGSEKS